MASPSTYAGFSGAARAQRRPTRLEVDMPNSQSDYGTPPATQFVAPPLLLGNGKGAVFLTQVHPVPAQAGLPSGPVGELLR